MTPSNTLHIGFKGIMWPSTMVLHFTSWLECRILAFRGVIRRIMIPRDRLRQVARQHLTDAKALLDAKRPDGAAYLCGYAAELTLKARICRTLKWAGFPQNGREFRDYQSLKTHNLDVLLHMTGRECFKDNYLFEWSIIANWSPEWRYDPPGQATMSDAKAMIEATELLLKKL